MAPSAFSMDELWPNKVDPTSKEVNVDCLMPNGVLIPLKVNRDATLEEIKEDLWDEAQTYPLYGMLRDKQLYVFSCINVRAELEELIDENRKLCDVMPFNFVLKIIERKGEKSDRLINSQISLVIGKGLHEFDALKNPEVNEFRWRMRSICEEIARDRDKKDWLDKVLYKYPVRLAATPELPDILKEKLRDNNLVILVRFENMETTFKFCVPCSTNPVQLLQTVLAKKAHTTGKQEECASDYVFKVCGQEEFLLGDHQLSQFKYVQNMISKDRNPQLVLISIDSIMAEECFRSITACQVETDTDENGEYQNIEEVTTRRSISSFSTMTLGRKKPNKIVSSWTVTEKFSFKINAICRLNCKGTEVAVQAGLFHGGEALCETRKTKEMSASDGEAQCEEDLEFDLDVCNIPRMTRLCLVVYEISKNTKGNKHRKYKGNKQQDQIVNPLAWVNTTVYDFKNQLKMGSITLYMWTYSEDVSNEDMLHPLGTVVSNPSAEHSTAMTVTFKRYCGDNIVVFPTMEKISEIARKDANNQNNDGNVTTSNTSKRYLEQLKQICERDALHQMHEQEKELIWFLRHNLMRHLPNSLSKLLQCVKWNDHKDIAQMMVLLEKWPRLPSEVALELLDYAYADQRVRQFAVECLRDMSDEDLLLYLLQLVQALKHESYLYSDLTEFLIQRALNNQKIGHFFFWHLRSEMHVPAVSVRFGLILEAYCRGSIEHMKCLGRQIDALGKLKKINETIRRRREPRDKLRQQMLEELQTAPFAEAFSNLPSPLDPRFKCRCLRHEKCKFMDSKMKPLWLVFQNDDLYGDDIFVIFKNGDDLRQDMLTLQMIRIMDKLWKDEGLDLRMNPYGCISTDHRVGLIEVVLNANTIANIQKEKGLFTATSTFKKGSLLEWLRDQNKDERSLNKAIEEFTLSCAGYCVATYVLGIADRHSDNIMVKRNGQLFHIDFGHILGNFKEKFGIRRERVPFVLTHDFVYVITKGQTQKSQEFSKFQQYCEQAFQILRRKGSLIISLFAMMLSTGIPELTCEKDLGYLRDTLVLDLPEPDAKKHFKAKFDEALRNSWKTSVNWLAHNLAKDNV